MWWVWNARLKEEVTIQLSRSSAPWIKSEPKRDSYLALDIPLILKSSFCSVFKCNKSYRIVAAGMGEECKFLLQPIYQNIINKSPWWPLETTVFLMGLRNSCSCNVWNGLTLKKSLKNKRGKIPVKLSYGTLDLLDLEL